MEATTSESIPDSFGLHISPEPLAPDKQGHVEVVTLATWTTVFQRTHWYLPANSPL